MSIEYGVRWRHHDGRTYEGVGYTRDGALLAVKTCHGKGYEPQAVEAVERTITDWQPIEVPS